MAGKKTSPNEGEEPAKEDALRRRIAQLVEQHGLRGLSRKIDVPNQNISRYLRGAQPSASFCRKLVEKLGVNPAWLLTGEGSPMLSDVPKIATATASGVLELVEAMNAVSRMRLGALAGKEHAKVLRELNDALARYEDLRVKLNTRSAPMFSQMLDMLDTVLAKERDPDKARPLIKTCEQLARLCADPELERRHHRLRAAYAAECGNTDEAVELARQLTLADFLRCEELDQDACVQASSLVAALRQQLRFRMARWVAEAALELTPKGGPAGLLAAAGICDIDLGELKRGRDRLSEALANGDPERKLWRLAMRSELAMASFLAGTADYREARAQCEPPLPQFMALLALWTEDVADVEDAVRLADTWKGQPNIRIDLMDVFARAALSVLQGGSATKALKLLEDGFVNLSDQNSLGAYRTYVLPVVRTQIALLGRDKRLATKHFQQVDEHLQAVAPRTSLPIIFAAIHHRNALRLSEGSRSLAVARQRATAFFERNIVAGYAAFRQCLL
ncbi:MAG: helix-turn-helix transcriptional regulator [Planctomycetes bacterium]|nr:helix-turn-helix transcriptional regulator [Planctomycetota bacterium]NUQ34001.1 helix-turn-helix domain-containing protein [Planctomycetaceae bacterium]